MRCPAAYGKFTVKSCYNYLLTRRNRSPSFDWRPWWKMKLPQRLLLFGWKIGRNCLPTKDNLIRRHIPLADDECPPFSKAPESVNHVFFMCDAIRSKFYLLLQGSNSKILNVRDHLTLFYIVFTVHQQLAIQPWFLNFSS